MRVLVYGGRDYVDEDGWLKRQLDQLHAEHGRNLIIIEGGARGADRAARFWARRAGIHSANVDALWEHFGDAAGPLRNTAMTLLEPHLGIECTGGRGTANMRAQLEAAGIKIRQQGDGT